MNTSRRGKMLNSRRKELGRKYSLNYSPDQLVGHYFTVVEES